MTSTSVEERIKRLNQLEPGVKAPTTQQLGSVRNRVQSLNISNKSCAMSKAPSKDKSQQLKTAKLISKSFSTDSADGDAPFSSAQNRQQQQTYGANDPNRVLSDDEDDGDFDAAAAMSYWRNRGKGNDTVRTEARENSSTTKKAANVASRAPAPVIKPATDSRTFASTPAERDPIVLPVSPPRLQHKQAPQSTFNQGTFRTTNKEEEEAPFDIAAAAASTSPVGVNYQFSSPTPPISSVKSTEAESLLSGGTDTSRASSTLSTRAKKFLKEKRKNGPILTGRGGGNENADGSGVETNRSTAKSILREKAAKDRLKKKTAAALSSKAPPIAVGEAADLGEYTTKADGLEHADFFPVVGKRDELGEDVTQIKADMPFDEPSKKKNTGDTSNMSKGATPDGVNLESIVSSNQLRNFAFASVDKANENHCDNASQQSETTKASQNSDIISVTEQGKSAHSESGSVLTEFTNQSELNSTSNNGGSTISNDVSQLTSKDSLPSDSGRKTNGQRRNPQAKIVAESAQDNILDTFGALAEDAGCQVLDVFASLSNACRGFYDDVNGTTNGVPFDEDVAIEVEYVERAE